MCGVFFVIYMGVDYLGKVYQVWFPFGFIGLSCFRWYVPGRGLREPGNMALQRGRIYN